MSLKRKAPVGNPPAPAGLLRSTAPAAAAAAAPASPEYVPSAQRAAANRAKASKTSMRDSPASRRGYEGEESSDAEGDDLQRVFENLKQLTAKKNLKHREKVETVVDRVFKEAESTAVRIMQEEEAKKLRVVERIDGEFKTLMRSLAATNKEVQQGTEAFHGVLRKAAGEFDRAVGVFNKATQGVIAGVASTTSAKEREDRVQAELRPLMSALRKELAAEREGGGGVSAKALPLLLSAFINN